MCRIKAWQPDLRNQRGSIWWIYRAFADNAPACAGLDILCCCDLTKFQTPPTPTVTEKLEKQSHCNNLYLVAVLWLLSMLRNLSEEFSCLELVHVCTFSEVKTIQHGWNVWGSFG